MVVIGIIAIALSFLVPALAPATARSLEGSARLFTAELENARQIAIAERTKTRVLIPDKNPTGDAFGANVSDLALRSFTTVSFNKTAATPSWKQRGKWTRLPQPATFDPAITVLPEEQNLIDARKEDDTVVDNSGSGAAQTFTGAYVEFLPNGSTSLNPTSPKAVLVLADGIPDGNGNMTAKNNALRYRIVIDPLTGSALAK